MPTEGADDGSTTENASLIARWDLDKTYLRTEFDTLGDIVRTALERPDQKRAVPGASVVLRELGQSGARIHIVSGSPRQMKRRLQEKLRIDKVRCDELTLKPNLSNALRLRLRALRDQLGYKLPVLLTARVRDQTRANGDTLVEEALVGDDAEADAFVYSLYADICEGEVSEKDLKRILKRGRVYSDQAERCLEAFPRIANGTVVRRILIHLDRQSQPSKFDPYGPGSCRFTTTSRPPSCWPKTACSYRRACSASRRSSRSATASRPTPWRGATSTCSGAAMSRDVWPKASTRRSES